MATTTNYSIYYPLASDAIAPLNTAFSTLASSVDTALTTNLTPIAGKVQTYLYSVANTTALNALTGMVNGSMAFVATGADGTWEQCVYLGSGDGWKVMNKPWTTYTHPAITGLTINTSRYRISDGIVTVQFMGTKVAGTTGVPTSTVVTNPSSAPSTAILHTHMPIGSGTFRSGTTSYDLTAVSTSTTATNIYYKNGQPSSYRTLSQVLQTTTTPKVAINDIIMAEFSYEKA
jgi:hypothetical protein